MQAVRRRPMRFGALQKDLGLNPAQVDRAVKFLRKGLWIVPRVAPSERGRMLVEYELGRRGAAFLESFKAFSVGAIRRKAELRPVRRGRAAELHPIDHGRRLPSRSGDVGSR